MPSRRLSEPEAPVGVAFLVESLACGGAERQLTELAARLDKNRYRPRVLVWQESSFHRDRLVREGIRVHTHRRKGRLDIYPALLSARWLRSREVSIVHGYMDPGNFYAVLAKRLAGRGVAIATERSQARPLASLTRLPKAWAHRRACLTVANSSSGEDFVHELAPRAKTRTVVIRNGVDTSRFRPVESERRTQLRRDLGWPTGRLVMLTAGSLEEEKNHVGLADALQQLKDDGRWEAWWFGEPVGEQGRRVQEHVRRCGLSDRVRFHSPIDDVERLYQAADFVVLASTREGTPNVVLEAMACGRPVLSTHVGDVGRYVVDGTTGWLAGGTDPTSLRAGLKRALGSTPADRERMGEAGLARLLELKLDADTMVRRYEDLYESLLDRS